MATCWYWAEIGLVGPAPGAPGYGLSYPETIYNGGMIYFMSDLSSKESDHRAFALRPSCY